MSTILSILDAIEQGEPNAAEQLLPLVYTELRELAARKLAHESPNNTLQPTALVHVGDTSLPPRPRPCDAS
jgi:hypothetical protein